MDFLVTTLDGISITQTVLVTVSTSYERLLKGCLLLCFALKSIKLVTTLDRISITQTCAFDSLYFLWEEYSKAVVVVVVVDDDEIRERLDEHNYWQN